MIWLESLSESVAQNGFAFSDEGLSQGQVISWRQVLESHQSQGFFRQAAVGREASLSLNESIRNDQISWLSETREEDLSILSEINSWRLFFNRQLFISARSTEAHFAHYSAGQFYKRHKDRHDSRASRILTFIVYLHERWGPMDGGELVIFDGETESIRTLIEPRPGRVVILKSDEVWHEVRRSKMDRLSLTGWFRNDSSVV
jgi:SM-20-related protein